MFAFNMALQLFISSIAKILIKKLDWNLMFLTCMYYTFWELNNLITF